MLIISSFFYWEIIDIYGKQIYEETNIRADYKEFDISNQSAGIYFVSISENNTIKIIKIVKK